MPPQPPPQPTPAPPITVSKVPAAAPTNAWKERLGEQGAKLATTGKVTASVDTFGISEDSKSERIEKRLVIGTGDGNDNIHISLDRNLSNGTKKVFTVEINGEKHQLVAERRNSDGKLETRSFDGEPVNTNADNQFQLEINLGKGNNSMLVDKDVSLDISITGQEGEDNVTFLGSGNSRIDLGDGKNKAKVDLQEQNYSKIKGGKDDDHIELYAGKSKRSRESSIAAGNGNNDVTLYYSDKGRNESSLEVSTGNGNDKLVFKAYGNVVSTDAAVNLTDSGGDNKVSVQGGSVALTVSNSNITGSNKQETVYIDGNNNLVKTSDGDDLVVITGNNNTVKLGNGNDRIWIGEGMNNKFEGNEGNNTLGILAKDEVVILNNTFTGEAGDTTFKVRIDEYDPSKLSTVTGNTFKNNGVGKATLRVIGRVSQKEFLKNNNVYIKPDGSRSN